MRTQFQYDLWILVPFLLLVAFGILMVASASMVISDRLYGQPFQYVIRQVLYVVSGFGLMWLMTRISLEQWKKLSVILLFVSLLMLFLVLMPGIGKVVNGSRRWLHIPFISFQVSEAVKLCSIIYLASYLERFQNQVQTELRGFVKPMIILGLMACLLLLEPDFGATTVITATFLALLFIAGVRIWPFTLLFVVVIGGMIVLAITSPYRLARLTTFLNPWTHAFGSGYQLTQSLIAFGRGGIFGVGLGNSVQKLFYLPEAHTDFIFAVIAEELGLIGELLLLLLYGILVARVFWVGRAALRYKNLFAGFLAMGLGFWIAFQTLINIGVSSGMLPTKGLTLPFISYGGSSLLVNCVMMGILLRVAYETNQR